MFRPGCWDVLASAGQDHLLKIYSLTDLDDQTPNSSQLMEDRWCTLFFVFVPQNLLFQIAWFWGMFLVASPTARWNFYFTLVLCCWLWIPVPMLQVNFRRHVEYYFLGSRLFCFRRSGSDLDCWAASLTHRYGYSYNKGPTAMIMVVSENVTIPLALTLKD